MRTTFLAALAMPALSLVGTPAAIAEDPKPAEPPAAEERSVDEEAPSKALASADLPKADEKAPLELPLGFKPKKRGKYIVYCRKDSAMGTRFPVEKCYDEQGIRDYLQAQREDQEKVDQMRRICGSQAACGAN